jgi:uncharacterized protein
MATDIEQKLTDELKDAMRSGDEVRRDAIRMVRAALKNEQIELQHARIAKRHRDSIAEFKKGNRPDLVAHEEAQLAVVERFAKVQMLPREQIEAEVRQTIAELDISGSRAMGPVMTALSKKLRDKADMRLVNEIVRAELAANAGG